MTITVNYNYGEKRGGCSRVFELWVKKIVEVHTLARSSNQNVPLAFALKRSPVLSQPFPINVSLVASGSFQ